MVPSRSRLALAPRDAGARRKRDRAIGVMAAAHCFVLVVGWRKCAFLSSWISPTMFNAMSMIPIVSSAKDDLVDEGLEGGPIVTSRTRLCSR